MDGWNTTFLLGRPIFRGYVSFREGIPPLESRKIIDSNIPWGPGIWIRSWRRGKWHWRFPTSTQMTLHAQTWGDFPLKNFWGYTNVHGICFTYLNQGSKKNYTDGIFDVLHRDKHVLMIPWDVANGVLPEHICTLPSTFAFFALLLWLIVFCPAWIEKISLVGGFNPFATY